MGPSSKMLKKCSKYNAVAVAAAATAGAAADECVLTYRAKEFELQSQSSRTLNHKSKGFFFD